MGLYETLGAFSPCNEQEKRDQIRMLEFLQNGRDAFLRANETAHFTASSWIVNPARDKVLAVYHNIYDSWSWTGGHADGEEDLLAVALREAREETGIMHIRPVRKTPFSIEVITVDGHEKRGAYVGSHLHYNVTYLLEADEDDVLRIKPDENSGVAWFSPVEFMEKVTEVWMKERVYDKLMKRLEGEV